MNFTLTALIMGIVATLVIDLWAEILSRVFKLPTTNWAMVGRWFGHLRRGVLIHRPIASSAPIKNEAVIGWVLHYVIGIVYGFIYLAFMQDQVDLLSAFVFGLLTIAMPWFVLQPGLGIGCLARLAPRPNISRAITLSMHSLFGCSLYLGWLLAANIL